VTERLAAVSPHLDDAVFGCGDGLAAHPGAVVVTVFAGRPPSPQPLGEWDAAAGFVPGDDVVGIRREEDACALRVLGATPLWLDFLDAQYAASPDVPTLTAALDAALTTIAPQTVLIPLGLFHNDHALAHEAALACARHGDGRRWLAYEEPMYRLLPEPRARRFAALGVAGVAVAAESPVAARATPLKRSAMLCYRSQLRALDTPGRPGWHDALEPERYWRLSM
jgi:LmbE family N-acetylglucosaminyl deacetylase